MSTHSHPLGPSTARIAGAAYVISIVVGMVATGAVGRLRDPGGDPAVTLAALRGAEPTLRLAIVGELGMYALVLVLAVSLYALLRDTGPLLALNALVFRVAEAVVGAGVAIVGSLLPLALLHAHVPEPALASAVHVLAGLGGPGMDVVLALMGVGGTLYFALFWCSRRIPRGWAGLGLLTYVTMLVVSVISLLDPAFPESIKIAVFAPGGIFELLVGLYLLVRGAPAREVDR